MFDAASSLLKRRRYVLLEQIGQGGFSSVFRAHDKLAHCDVAVKVVPRDLAGNATSEAHILARVRDVAGVLRLRDFYKTQRHYYLVLDLCRGGELYDRIIAGDGVGERDARLAAIALLRTVAELHDRNVLHRDIKPENVLFRRADSACDDFVLVDLGLSVVCEPGAAATAPGFAGSAGYVAPEVFHHHASGRPADIWSLGLVVYAMLTGRSPFHSRTPSGLAWETVTAAVAFPADLWARCSAEALDFCRGLLCYDPARRMTAREALAHPWLAGGDMVDGVRRRGSVASTLSTASSSDALSDESHYSFSGTGSAASSASLTSLGYVDEEDDQATPIATKAPSAPWTDAWAATAPSAYAAPRAPPLVSPRRQLSRLLDAHLDLVYPERPV